MTQESNFEIEPTFVIEADKRIYEHDPELFAAIQHLNDLPDDELFEDLVEAGVPGEWILSVLEDIDPGFFDIDTNIDT